MSHVPHPFQPPAPVAYPGGAAFDPRRAMRSPHHPGQMPGAAPNLMPMQRMAHPQPPYGAAPQPAAYGHPSVPAQPAFAHPAQAQPMAYGIPLAAASQAQPLSKRDAKRAAKVRAKAEKAQAKAMKKGGRSPLIPFILGMFAGGVMTAYLSNALFAPRQLDGPAWTLPSAADVPLSDVPLAEAVPDDQIAFDEGDG